MERCLEKEKRRKEPSPEQGRILNRQHLSPDPDQFSARLGRSLASFTERLGGWTFDFVVRHWLGIINFHILVFLVGAIEAPLLLYLDQPWICKIFYGFYGFFCHQDPSRSLFLFGNQVAICSRCLAFCSSLLAFGLLLSLKRVKPLSLRPAVLLMLPALVSVLLQTLRIRESTNLVRVTTGTLLGMAASLYLYPRVQRALKELIARGYETPGSE